jgi:spermidine synthase
VTLYLIFLLSGAAGLIYQVVWVREFGNVFGNTVHSASLVIAIFMLGLGAGSALAGVWADRRWAARGSLLAAYARVELAIAAGGFAISTVLPRLEAVSAAVSWYTPGAHGWHVLSAGSYLARYAIAVALLTPVTLLMGATLTLLIRHCVQRDLALAGWRIGALYGVNTAGAALGCFFTDYAFIPNVGLFATQMIAVLFNLVAGAVALRLAGGDARPLAPAADAVAKPDGAAGAPQRRIALAIFLSGLAAMGMEIVWFRHLSSLFGSYRSVLSLILTVVLVGIWLGALTGGWLHRRFGRPALFYLLSQALFVVSAIIGLARADVRTIVDEQTRAYVAFLASTGVQRDLVLLWLNAKPLLREIALPALLMGFAYPLANAAVQDAERAVGRRAGALYLANTVGAVAGALGAGFVLLPALGMQRTIAVLALVATAGLVPLYAGARGLAARPGRTGAITVAFGTSLAAAAAATVFWLGLPRDFVIERTLYLRPGERRLTVSEGLTEVIAVTEIPGSGRVLMTNGHSMSSTSILGQRYMRAFAHVPLLSMPAPERALVICFGVGNTAHAATLHPTIRRVDVVDTSRHVLEHARWFSESNGDVLRSPKVAVYVNDGRQHLRMQPPATYDMITLEPPPIPFAGVGALYSRDFYALARGRLRPGGYLTQWLPAYQVPGDVSLSMVRAFVEVFPESVLLSGAMSELILVGFNGPTIEIDPEQVAARLAAAPAVREDLRRVSLGTLTEIVGTFGGAAPTLLAATDLYRPITDDLPINEYAIASRLSDQQIPGTLFDVRRVTAWCPKCFDHGQPRPGLEDLPAWLGIFGRVYQDASFRQYYWPYRPPGTEGGVRVSMDGATTRMIAASPYLQTLFRAPSPRP